MLSRALGVERAAIEALGSWFVSACGASTVTAALTAARDA
jgi:hypothetical protein